MSYIKAKNCVLNKHKENKILVYLVNGTKEPKTGGQVFHCTKEMHHMEENTLF
mgnify:CR=1 FL=1